MPYELHTSPETIELSVSAPSREELFRAALAGVLEAAYGANPPEGTGVGRVVPVQASAGDDEALLVELLDDVLRAARDEKGTLQPPRWLAFDERRVTATLPVTLPGANARPIEASSAEIARGETGWTARVEFLPPSAG